MLRKTACTTVVLIAALTATRTDGVILGDWENADDGWLIAGGAPAGTTIGYSATGATLGSSSLRLHVPEGGWKTAIYLKLQDYPELIEAFRNGTKIRFDVTRIASEWTGDPADGGGGLHVIVNAGGDGWSSPPDSVWDDVGGGAVGWWSYRDGDDTRTIEVDYSATLPKIRFGSVWWLEIWVITNYDTDYTTGGIYYLDNFEIPLDMTATNPNPPDGATGLPTEVRLGWKPGAQAISHDVYLGTDPAAVADVNQANLAAYPEITFRNVATESLDTGRLELETTYYWRVDEVGAAETWPGSVWSFTVGNYLTLEDMESYEFDPQLPPDANWIFYVWVDGLGDYDCLGVGGNGTGANVYSQDVLFTDGAKGMRFDYDNDGTAENPCTGTEEPRTYLYSKAEAKIANLPSKVTSDWQGEALRMLSLRFFGDSLNDVEPMWLELADDSDNIARVFYGDHEGEEPNDIAEDAWHDWEIPLFDFAGVDFSEVNSIAIGFGTGDAPGGSGVVYFDEIMLSRPQCILARRSAEFTRLDYRPAGEPAGDCVVDGLELEVLAGDWLAGDDVISTQSPGTAGLVAHYPLDEGSGNIAGDASGQGHDGTITDNVQWIDGMAGFGKALDFPGLYGQFVDTNTWNPSEGTGQLTASVWIKWAGPTGGYQGVLAKRDDWNSADTMWHIELNNTTGNIAFARFDNYPWFGNDNIPPIGRWQHVAVTFDGATTTMYIDGKPVGTSTTFTFGPKTDAHVVFGAVGRGGSNPFNGAIDEVRLYNRALAPAEVAYLADTTPGDGQLYYAVPSDAELYDAEPQGSRKVDFKDFAVLMNAWLDDQKWPWQ